MKKKIIAGLAVLAALGALLGVKVSAQGEDVTVLYNEIDARGNLIIAQENLLNAYRCRFGVDTQVVQGGCEDGVPRETLVYTPYGSTAPEPVSAPEQSAAYGHSCLVTDGCSFSYFGVPGGRPLKVNTDIAPGKWNSDYEGPGDNSCHAVRLSAAVTSHPNYTDEVNTLHGVEFSAWTTWFSDLLLVQQPSGRYTEHESVIEHKNTDYVYGPRQFQIEIKPTDYAVIITYC